jgi:hypothetical protein
MEEDWGCQDNPQRKNWTDDDALQCLSCEKKKVNIFHKNNNHLLEVC